MAETDREDDMPSRLASAYARVLPEMDALPASEVITINIDVPTAVTSALGAWPKISMLRSELAMRLPDFDVAQLDRLEAYARATAHAHALYMAASSPTGLQQLGERVAKLREVLCSDAVALSKRGLLDGERLKQLKGPPGYKNMAFDLLALAALFRERWSALEGKTPIQLNELTQAETLAEDLIAAVGRRERASTQATAASDRRQRAFTLLANAYDQARRGITYLRWNDGDADLIAPSLYAGRGNTRRRVSDESELPAAEPAPIAQPQAPSASNASSADPAQAPFGMPGGRPFLAS
jgi:hypothetical protein